MGIDVKAKRSFNFSDLGPNVTARLGFTPTDDRHLVSFEEPDKDLNRIYINVMNGGWGGWLNCDEEGSLQIVDDRGKIHERIYIVDVMEKE